MSRCFLFGSCRVHTAEQKTANSCCLETCGDHQNPTRPALLLKTQCDLSKVEFKPKLHVCLVNFMVPTHLRFCQQTFLSLSEHIKWQRVVSPHRSDPTSPAWTNKTFSFFFFFSFFWVSLGCSSVCPSEFRVLLFGDVPSLEGTARVFRNPTKPCGHLNNMCDCLTVSMVTSGLGLILSANQCSEHKPVFCCVGNVKKKK